MKPGQKLYEMIHQAHGGRYWDQVFNFELPVFDRLHPKQAESWAKIEADFTRHVTESLTAKELGAKHE